MEEAELKPVLEVDVGEQGGTCIQDWRVNMDPPQRWGSLSKPRDTVKG